jgi:uncharacterized protein (DUF2147 family)
MNTRRGFLETLRNSLATAATVAAVPTALAQTSAPQSVEVQASKDQKKKDDSSGTPVRLRFRFNVKGCSTKQIADITALLQKGGSTGNLDDIKKALIEAATMAAACNGTKKPDPKGKTVASFIADMEESGEHQYEGYDVI